MDISEDRFEGIRTISAEKSESVYEGWDEELERALKENSAAFSKYTDTDTTYTQTPAGYRRSGIFASEDHHIGELLIGSVVVDVDGQSRELAVVTAANIIVVEQRLIYAHLHCTCVSQSDIDWQIAKSFEWVAAVRAAN